LVNSSKCSESAYSSVDCQLIRLSLLGQMDELVVIDEHGHMHSACLHCDGLPHCLWELLSAAGYPQPPLYDGHDFVESGVRRCSVTMVIPQHPLNGWEPIVNQVICHRMLDT